MKKKYERFCFQEIGSRAKKTLLTVAAVMLTSFGLFAQLDVTLGSGTGTTSYFPIYYLYNYSYSQTIYTADELTDEGVTGEQTITTIRYKATSSVPTSSWKDWVVYIGNTTEEGFSSDFDWVSISNLEEVFDGEIASNVVAGDWLEIELDTPFQWDGTSNIVVAVDQNTGSYGSSPSWAGYTLAPSSGSKGICFYSDSNNPDPSSPPTSGSYSQSSNSVAQIQFEMTPTVDCAGMPSAGTVDGPSTFGECLDQPFQIKMDGVEIASGITYEWQGRAAGSSDTWQFVGSSATLNYPANAFNEDLEFQLIVTCTNSGEVDTSDLVTVTLNPADECYCEATCSSAYDYIPAINSSGALENVSYEPGTQSSNGYADETAQEFSAFETQTIDFEVEYVGGQNTVNIWVDWNQNGIFEGAELMVNQNGSSPQTMSIVVPSGTPEGDYRVRVRGMYDYSGSASLPPCGSVAYGTTIDFNLTIVTPPACLPVTDLDLTSLGATEAEIEWTIGGSGESAWNIEWGEPGFTPGQGDELGADVSNTNSYTITGLEGNTDYDIYVQADCDVDSLSYWSTISITTECDVLEAFGYCEDVEGDISTLACWKVGDYDGDGYTWAVYSGNANSGDKSFGIDTWLNVPNDYLFMPRVALTGNEVLSFYYKESYSGYTDQLEVLLSTTGTAPADFQDTLLAAFAISNTSYQDTAIDLSAYSGDVIIAFHVPASSGNTGDMIYIDDVCMDICTPVPGVDGDIEVCRLDGTVDLDDVITSEYDHGTWILPENQGVVDGSTLNVTALPSGTFEVEYIVSTACTSDTTIATVTVYSPSSAGNGGTITVCKNSAVDLYSGISGNVDMGGDWYDYNGNLLPNSQPISSSIPGSYNYKYITSNALCPADTAVIEVIVDPTCDDGLSVGEQQIAELSVHPNPATTVLHIDNPSNASNLNIDMLDMNGRVVLSRQNEMKNASEVTLDISKLERGIYTLRLYNDEGQKTFKVVKQ